MKKIISLFQRNYETDHLVRNEIVPGAEWVVNGEGVATRKFDGTAVLVAEGKLYKRYEIKNRKQPPAGFIPAQEPDPVTGDTPGWVPVDGGNPADMYHVEAAKNWVAKRLPDVNKTFIGNHIPDGTYELIGPKVQGNREGWKTHELIPHGIKTIPNAPRTFDELRKYFEEVDIEGIVWHHPDGRMVKIKARDFGIKRKKRELVQQ